MFEPEELSHLRDSISNQAQADRKLLDDLRAEVRSFAGDVRTIQPRSTTAMSLVASDGGNNSLVFDPFHVQLVRVVDSYGKQLFLDAISPTTDTDKLSASQFDEHGNGKTALGRMMGALGVKTLHELSPMIPSGEKIRKDPDAISPSWVLVFRDLCEWAVLFDIIQDTTFATDTLIVRDGLLRSKMFSHDLFMQLKNKIEEAIGKNASKNHRKIYLVSLAKHSKVIARYELAMELEKILPAGQPRYVRIPRDLEAKAYVWPEYARGAEAEGGNKEQPKFVMGDLFLVRFGSLSGDPLWAVDVLSSQAGDHQDIFGYLLADAINGFPVPFYPRCLQRAHEHAEVVGFDLDILQDEIFRAIRGLLPLKDQDSLEAFRLHPDLTGRRYSN